VWVHATVWSVPQATERGQRVELMINRLCPVPALADCNFEHLPDVSVKVLINVYQPLPLVPGQQWQLQLRVRKPHGFANPGGFDYEAWLMQQDIRGTGYLREHVDNVLLPGNSGQRHFNRLRAWLMAKLDGAG